jgi:hypothetical protein
MKVSLQQVRRLTAEDYARKASAGGDVALLFEFALEEGWLTGVAAAVELALERGDNETVRRLRELVAALKRPAPLPPRTS